jgi:hypothetical protein
VTIREWVCVVGVFVAVTTFAVLYQVYGGGSIGP